ncbi:hypothetical protein Maes01_01528 [Microbulbifer aestuariivivens]|uniref:Uncharacterized protein n=1 Tax=Microbulbifer aestuariivivens TaxID=1908308 RepID=A0ABP9WQV1_9GAMM
MNTLKRSPTRGTLFLVTTLALLLTAVSGCVSQRSSMEEIHVNALEASSPKGKTLVIVYSRNPELAAKLESEWAKQLSAKGYNVQAWHTVAPDEFSPEYKVIQSLVNDTGATTILSSEILNRKKMEREYPSSQVAIIETNLFDAGSEKLLWSTVFETFLLSPDGEKALTPSDTKIEEIISDQLVPMSHMGLVD